MSFVFIDPVFQNSLEMTNVEELSINSNAS